MSKTIQIEIVSDFACPWCFIGERRLMKAIHQRSNIDIQIAWRPFQLNPDMPREGCNRRDYYQKKFGAEGAKHLQQTLKIAGAEEEIIFCDEPDAIAPNTLSAHMLMYWAMKEKKIDLNSLAEKIFHAHHVACENIGDHDVLVRIAEEVGMDQISVISKLSVGEDEGRVKDQIHQASAQGISSVPCFIFNTQHCISGAQSITTLVSVLDQLCTAP